MLRSRALMVLFDDAISSSISVARVVRLSLSQNQNAEVGLLGLVACGGFGCEIFENPRSLFSVVTFISKSHPFSGTLRQVICEASSGVILVWRTELMNSTEAIVDCGGVGIGLFL